MNIIKYFIIVLAKSMRQCYRHYQYFKHTGKFPSQGCIFINIKNISIGENFSTGINCQLYAQDMQSKLVIGDNVSLNSNVFLGADFGEIYIGDNVMIGPNTVIRAANHSFRITKETFNQQEHKHGVIKIGDNVWIAANVVITSNTTIGNNVVVGAGSIITKDVPDNVIVAGNPAQLVKELN